MDPAEQVDLDDLEEDLGDFGEYVRSQGSEATMADEPLTWGYTHADASRESAESGSGPEDRNEPAPGAAQEPQEHHREGDKQQRGSSTLLKEAQEKEATEVGQEILAEDERTQHRERKPDRARQPLDGQTGPGISGHALDGQRGGADPEPEGGMTTNRGEIQSPPETEVSIAPPAILRTTTDMDTQSERSQGKARRESTQAEQSQGGAKRGDAQAGRSQGKARREETQADRSRKGVGDGISQAKQSQGKAEQGGTLATGSQGGVGAREGAIPMAERSAPKQGGLGEAPPSASGEGPERFGAGRGQESPTRPPREEVVGGRERRKAGRVAEFLLRAGASVEKAQQVLEGPKAAAKRAREVPAEYKTRDKRERLMEADEEPEGHEEMAEVCMFADEEDVAWARFEADLAKPRGHPREGRGSSEKEDQDEVEIVATVAARHRMPKYVTEHQVMRDYRGRDSIPLSMGESKLILEKLDQGARAVRKIIVFRADPRGPVVDAHEFLREDKGAAVEEDYDAALRRIRKFNLPVGDKIRLIERTREIQDVGRENGNRNDDEVMEMVARVAGWPSARLIIARADRLASDLAAAQEKCREMAEQVKQSREANAAREAQAKFTQESLEQTRRDFKKGRQEWAENKKKMEEALSKAREEMGNALAQKEKAEGEAIHATSDREELMSTARRDRRT